jgi:DNA-binding PadR family transcriptional regulator
MEHEGLLVSRQEVVDGHARRVYDATAEGRTTLKRTHQALRELADEILE